MRKLFDLAKRKTINFFKWLWAECKDWHTIALLGVVCLVLGSPVWVGYLIGFVFRWDWALIAASVVWAFWMLPGAPFVALSVSITLFIKRMWERRQRRKKQGKIKEAESNEREGE